MKIQKWFVAFLICLISLHVHGKSVTREFNFGSFQEARKAPSVLKFEIISTAVLFSHTVHGYAKSFSITGDLKDKTVANVVVTFKAKSLDTENESRDIKLHEFCLDYEKYPEVSVKIAGPLAIDGSKKSVDAVMLIRGKEKKIPVDIKVSREKNGLYVEGGTVVTYPYLEIPDPSIFVATLDKDIKITFKIHIRLN